MFNKHAILALAAISTEALKLKQEIVGGDPSTWAPMQELSVDLDDYMPIAGGEGTGTPQQELSVELAQVATEYFWETCAWKQRMGYPCDGTESSLAQVEGESQADVTYTQNYVECIIQGGMYCDPLWEGLAQVEGESQTDAEQNDALYKLGGAMFAQADAALDDVWLECWAWGRYCDPDLLDAGLAQVEGESQ